MEFKFKNILGNSQNNLLEEQMKQISPIKQIIEEDSGEKSQKTSDRHNSIDSQITKDNRQQEDNKFMKLIFI